MCTFFLEYSVLKLCFMVCPFVYVLKYIYSPQWLTVDMSAYRVVFMVLHHW